MRLNLKKSDTIVELLSDRLLLVVASHGALKCANGVAVMRTNVGDVGVESAAEGGVTIADASALGECMWLGPCATLGAMCLTRIEVDGWCRVGERVGEVDGNRHGHDGAEKLGDSEHA